MSDCCAPTTRRESSAENFCPSCEAKGRSVDTVTLRCLLVPDALQKLLPDAAYRFCATSDCETVYFTNGQRFTKKEITVPVFQKDAGEDVHACYCFDYTRRRLRDEVHETGRSDAVEAITRLVKEGRCACEFRNPQGNCCLGNVNEVIMEARASQKLFQPRKTSYEMA